MLVEITITDDNGDVTMEKARLSRWKVTLLELKLLSAVLNRPLAETYLACATVGIDVLMQEYARDRLKQRKTEVRTFIEGGKHGCHNRTQGA